jgi:cytidylate kinase
MSLPSVITIDGPAGAGKSTLGALLAERIGYLYFDTGVMYRALTLVAQQNGIDPDDETALNTLARRVAIEVTPPSVSDGRQYDVLADGADITWAIRSPTVERDVSRVARFPQVRQELNRLYRVIGRRGQVVMVGRDIGTVVMPDAGLKLYVDASLDERVRRRALEQHLTPDDSAALARLRSEMARRDALDRHVMQPAADAVILQTDGLSLEDEVAWVLDYLAC